MSDKRTLIDLNDETSDDEEIATQGAAGYAKKPTEIVHSNLNDDVPTTSSLVSGVNENSGNYPLDAQNDHPPLLLEENALISENVCNCMP